MRIRVAALTSAMVMLSAPVAVLATPVYQQFGSLPGANFGGTGIPNTSVAKTEVFVNGTDQITLGLTAHGRYSNPVVTDNGAGDYYALPGQNCGINTDPVGCPSASQGALWNFAYYINIVGGGDFADYAFRLYYDFDPGAGTLLADLGTIELSNVYPPATTLAQDSENLLFGFLAGPAIPFVLDPPTVASFNPNALGEYNFYLGVSSPNVPGFSGLVGIDVNVVPVPGAVWLLGSAMGLLAWVRRKATA